MANVTLVSLIFMQIEFPFVSLRATSIICSLEPEHIPPVGSPPLCFGNDIQGRQTYANCRRAAFLIVNSSKYWVHCWCASQSIMNRWWLLVMQGCDDEKWLIASECGCYCCQRNRRISLFAARGRLVEGKGSELTLGVGKFERSNHGE